MRELEAKIADLEQEIIEEADDHELMRRAVKAVAIAKSEIYFEGRLEELNSAEASFTATIFSHRPNFRPMMWTGLPEKPTFPRDGHRLTGSARSAIIQNAHTLREAKRRLKSELEGRKRELIDSSDSLGIRPLNASARGTLTGHLREELAPYKAELARRMDLKDKKRRQEHEVRAVKASLQGRTREAAQSVRRQLEVTQDCPYCGGPLGTDPHADHIYTVSLGGQSRYENMVLVCKDCNMKKRDRTLREFIAAAKLDRESVEARLGVLRKQF